MHTSFISFVSDYTYKGEQKVYIEAPSRLNKWLDEHPDVEIVNWKTQRVGKDGALCIVVEYKNREYYDHY